MLQHTKNQFPDVEISCGAFLPVKEFFQLEEMLIKEKTEFVVNCMTLFSFTSIMYS
jgi:1-phosphatidylinositol-3-phosphate 5-kinase